MVLVSLVSLASMAGVAVVGVVPATLGAGMAALFILGLVDGPRGGRLSGEEEPAGTSKGRKAA